MQKEAAENHEKRLSWGVVDFLRKKKTKRQQQDASNAYCDLRDLAFFKIKANGVLVRTQYVQGDINNNISTRINQWDF